MTIECVMESWWDNNFFVKLRRPRIVKILFFLTFCLIEALLVSSIYIGNNIVNESKKPDLTQQTKYTQQIDKHSLIYQKIYGASRPGVRNPYTHIYTNNQTNLAASFMIILHLHFT